MNAGRLALQALLLAAFVAAIGWLSRHPAYIHHNPELALIKISFRHASERKEECRRLSPAEIAALPPNMRRPEQCGRERVPVRVEIDVDGRTVVAEELTPAGLAQDGSSTIYRRISVPAGGHVISMRLRDNRSLQGFDYERTESVTLEAGRILVIDFRAPQGGFLVL